MKVSITIRGILICGFCLLFLSHASACDMMGVSFNKEVDLNNLFSRFRTISEKKDPDGWGVAFYGDASATVFKEPIRAAESDLAEFLITNRSPEIEDTDRASPRGQYRPAIASQYAPWTRELGGKEYALAHVGGADKRLWQTVKLGRFKPFGENCAEFSSAIFWQRSRSTHRDMERGIVHAATPGAGGCERSANNESPAVRRNPSLRIQQQEGQLAVLCQTRNDTHEGGT